MKKPAVCHNPDNASGDRPTTCRGRWPSADRPLAVCDLRQLERPPAV
ncbi:hypothetical protein [Mobilibacterium timonense]|nr:hypothetical protein [Mobilibacterium timonense]